MKMACYFDLYLAILFTLYWTLLLYPKSHFLTYYFPHYFPEFIPLSNEQLQLHLPSKVQDKLYS